MERRDFLKGVIGGAAAIAVPSVGLANKAPESKLTEPLPDEELFVGLDADSWIYRGWNVEYKGVDDEGEYTVSRYYAARDNQYIDLEVDNQLLNLRVSPSDKRKLVNSELDAYIELTDSHPASDNTSPWNVNWDQKGSIESRVFTGLADRYS